MVTPQARTPLLSGLVPPLADSFFPRSETGPNLTALQPGQTVALTPGEPVGQGGTGKTQLAIEFAHTLWNARAVEVLVWVTAASREAIITSFAQAANAVGADDPEEGAEETAARFVTWLAHTSRPWALVIDDLVDPDDLRDLWPWGPTGQVVITTRRPGAELSMAAGDLRIVPVNAFSRREALAYLGSRLTEYSDQRMLALDLCEDVGGLPICLDQAAAVIGARGMACRDYRAQFSERHKHMAGLSIPGLSAEVLTTWSLAVECAQELAPAGLAWPALTLAAMLDSHAIPLTALTGPAAFGFITGHPAGRDGPDKNLVRTAIANLARTGLVVIDTDGPGILVRMHPSVQAATRAYLPRADLEQVALTAADALAEAWQESDGGPQLEQILRDCAAAVRATDSGSLWKPEVHPLLLRTGVSMEASGLASSAIGYWESMLATSTRLGGPAQASAMTAKDRLGAAYQEAGRADDAITVFQSSLTDRERTLGPDHPETLTALGRLAHSYQAAGKLSDAVTLYERTVAGLGRQLGPGHLDTLAVRARLAATYLAADLPKDALTAYKALVADSERLLGPTHPDTLAARSNLAEAFQVTGKTKDAIEQHKRVLSDLQGLRGRDHPDTIGARAALASTLRRAGKTKDAIAQYEAVLADRRRTEGPDHPDTIAALANLAFAYRSAGQMREALPAYEHTLADRERVQGPDHRDTRTARSNLAAAYLQVGRVTDAIPQYERALADSERMLGPGNIETLTARCSLASALYSGGRLMEVVTVLERALADCEHYLGPGHPMTQTVRENLDAATKT